MSSAKTKKKIPAPGEFFRAGNRAFRRAPTGLEEDFGGLVGRAIRATEYTLEENDDFIKAVDLEWVPLRAVASVFEDEDSAWRWLRVRAVNGKIASEQPVAIRVIRAARRSGKAAKFLAVVNPRRPAKAGA